MGEISGFGGGYEEACQRMARAGLEWLEANQDLEPDIGDNPNVFGVFEEKNTDARSLSDVIADAEDGCTGAMCHAAISICMYVKTHGWDAYVEALKEREKGDPK